MNGSRFLFIYIVILKCICKTYIHVNRIHIELNHIKAAFKDIIQTPCKIGINI